MRKGCVSWRRGERWGGRGDAPNGPVSSVVLDEGSNLVWLVNPKDLCDDGPADIENDLFAREGRPGVVGSTRSETKGGGEEVSGELARSSPFSRRCRREGETYLLLVRDERSQMVDPDWTVHEGAIGRRLGERGVEAGKRGQRRWGASGRRRKSQSNLNIGRKIGLESLRGFRRC